MSKLPCTKPALTYAAQLQQLKDRGLTFANEPKALLDKYPNIDTRAMGFPDTWKNEPLWK